MKESGTVWTCCARSRSRPFEQRQYGDAYEVPAQNEFMKQLHLKEKLNGYKGIVIAWSAGSMNCAETVYAAPELEGEAVDPFYERGLATSIR